MRTMFGVTLILLCGLSLGCSRAAALKKREDALRDLKNLMTALRAEIAYASRPLGETICMLSQSSICRAAAQSPFVRSDPQAALRLAGEKRFSNPEDQALFLEWVAGLGGVDTQGQISQIDLFLSRLEQHLCEAAQDRTAKSRLYVCLGFCGALSLCILLL